MSSQVEALGSIEPVDHGHIRLPRLLAVAGVAVTGLVSAAFNLNTTSAEAKAGIAADNRLSPSDGDCGSLIQVGIAANGQPICAVDTSNGNAPPSNVAHPPTGPTTSEVSPQPTQPGNTVSGTVPKSTPPQTAPKPIVDWSKYLADHGCAPGIGHTEWDLPVGTKDGTRLDDVVDLCPPYLDLGILDSTGIDGTKITFSDANRTSLASLIWAEALAAASTTVVVTEAQTTSAATTSAEPTIEVAPTILATTTSTTIASGVTAGAKVSGTSTTAVANGVGGATPTSAKSVGAATTPLNTSPNSPSSIANVVVLPPTSEAPKNNPNSGSKAPVALLVIGVAIGGLALERRHHYKVGKKPIRNAHGFPTRPSNKPIGGNITARNAATSKHFRRGR